MSDFNPYDDVKPLNFADVATGFDFRSPKLGIVDFPESFVRAYVRVFENAAYYDDTDAVFWPQSLGHGAIMFENILAPGDIFAINKTLEESLYADKDAVVLPPGLYAAVECVDDLGPVYLMVNLIKTAPEYGKMYFWRKAHEALGTGDNTTLPVYAAANLGAFFEGLLPESEAKAKLRLG